MEGQSGELAGLPCEHCPKELLGRYLSSPLGTLIAVVMDLETALQLGVAVSLNQIPYSEFLLLRQLGEERKRFENEQLKKRG